MSRSPRLDDRLLRQGRHVLCGLLALAALLPPPRVHALASQGAGSTAALPTDLASRAEAFLGALREEWGAPAVSAAVALDGELAFAGAVGVTDVEGSVATPQTRFRIASVSKAITGVLLLTLAEEGTVDLDASVLDIVPELPAQLAPVTSRQLLSHTSGIRHYQPGETSHRTEHYDSPLTALEEVLAEPLAFEPGSRAGYTTYGYTVLQAVVEKATGLPFEEALRRHVLEPAGMERTGLDRVGEEHRRATGFDRRGPVGPDDVSFKYAGGGMISTPSDLVSLCTALQRGDLLGPSFLEELRRPQAPELDPRQGPGFAVERELTSGLLRLWHPGRGNGFEGYLLCYPEEGVATAVLTNQDWTDPRDEVGRAAETFARMVLPAIHDYRSPPDLLERRLEARLEAGDTMGAIEAYRTYRQRVDGIWNAGLQVHRLAERLSAAARLKEADALWTENAEAYPDSWNARLALARSRLRLGDLVVASSELEAARALGPDLSLLRELEELVEVLGTPTVAEASGRWELVLTETGVVDRLEVKLDLEEGAAAAVAAGRAPRVLGGAAASQDLADLELIRAVAGGDRVWVSLSSSYGLVELELRRDGQEVEGRWSTGGDSGPLAGRGPIVDSGQQP